MKKFPFRIDICLLFVNNTQTHTHTFNAKPLNGTCSTWMMIININIIIVKKEERRDKRGGKGTT